jgi:outer membrane usher protein
VRGQTNITTDLPDTPLYPLYDPTMKTISLDEQQVSGAEIDNIVKTVVPTRNAIVKVKYDTWIGYKAMITMRFKNKAVPFGAVMTLDDENLNEKNAVLS